ncbi:hypothetical protein LZL87_006957 [Fusarium oxysporum]|nr:hypothetical protein LZL87_006957 [Fusarium oxysporum]
MVLRLRRLLTPDMYEDPSPECSQYMPIVMEGVAEFIRIWDRRTDISPEVRDMCAFFEAQQFRDGAGFRVGVASMRLQEDDSTVALKRTRTYLLRQLADKHPTEFSRAIEDILQGWNDSHSIDEFFSLGFDSWAMPTRSEVKRMLILKEDRYAAAFPESHIIGMIPFCQENPKLHIEHRINLWRNILARGDDKRIRGLMFRIEGPLQVLDNTPERHQTEPLVIGRTFTGFIMHLLEALKKGLPSDSYSFIVSGYPDLNRATEVFSESMKPYVAWLTAHMTDCIAYGLIAPSSHHDRPFPTRNSPRGIAPVSGRSAIFQCDFTLDQPWNWETIYNESGVSTISTLERLSIFGMGLGTDFLDVTTDLLDWEKVQRESYEMEELSEGVFAEPYNDRYLT